MRKRIPMIEIKVESFFERYSNFNTIIMCGGFNAAAEGIYVVAAQKDEGATLTRLEAEDADGIEAIIYFIPKSLPGEKDEEIKNFPPFDATITITKGEKKIYDTVHQVNGWGGAAVRLKLNV